jgi:GntR family transcriptional repressor for pyruvate dehydrogenase complex
MRQLHVGRSSVREALRGLITLGVVETKPGRGAVVLAQPRALAYLQSGRESLAYLEKWAVLDLLEVRESLEGQAAELAAQRATTDDLHDIERGAREVEARVAAGFTYFQANTAFHRAIARASHNSTLAESLQQLVQALRGYRERLMREIRGMPARDVAEHHRIVEAIRHRKPATARSAMVRHIRNFAKLVRAFETTLPAPRGGRRPPRGTRTGSGRGSP